MPRTARDERLNTPTVRLALTPRREPYWRVIQEGRAIGYRRLAGGKAGTWIARHYDPTEGRKYQSLGVANDNTEADGSGTMTFAQAQEAARKWFRAIDRAGGRVEEPVTVAEALESYVSDYQARGGKALIDLNRIIAAHIKPAFGTKCVDELTTRAIKAWHNGLATAPARLHAPCDLWRWPSTCGHGEPSIEKRPKMRTSRLMPAVSPLANASRPSSSSSRTDIWRMGCCKRAS